MRIEHSKMAETEELKQMVLSFRRAELVELLGFVGLNKVGVKATLLQRAMALINSSRGCSLPVQIKVRELYRQIHNPYSSEPPRARTVSSVRTQQAEQDLSNKYLTQAFGKTNSVWKIEGSRRYASSSKSSSSMVTGLSGLTNVSAVDYTKQRTSDSISAGNSSLPVHPDVSFKPLPFYDIMGELLKPTSLVPKGPARYQETYFVFHLTPQQAQDIAMSRDFRPSAKCEYTVQVQLRFCMLETSCEQDDNFPPSICVRVNGKVASLPNPIPNTKPGVEPKRPGRPVDITSLCRISPTMPNHIEISWASEYGRCYCVSINLVKRLTSDILLSRLKQFGNRHADHTRALIKDKLQQDPDCEIATTSLRVSLRCPLGKMRMMLPCRASSCTHLQCFDANTFLMMNEKKATWLCAVCDKPTPFHKLIIDGLFVEILQKVSDIDEIQFVEDGSWSPIRNNKQTHILSSPVVNRSKAQENTVNLCSDSTSESTSPPKKQKMEVIDLTETDSEDESEPPARPQSSQEISSGSSTPSLILNTNVISPQSTEAVSPTETKPLPSCAMENESSSSESRHTRSMTAEARAEARSNVSLPPLPISPFYKSTSSSSPSLSKNSSNTSRSTNGSGLNLSASSPSNGYGPYATTSGASSFSVTEPSLSIASTPSWLTALSGQQQGQKRPPPAHSNNSAPTAKRPYLDKLTDSPTSSNSNMSPLVDLDQLCSILDSDRDRNSEEILSFPPDFPMPLNTHGASSGSGGRTMFSPSPPDVISLD